MRRIARFIALSVLLGLSQVSVALASAGGGVGGGGGGGGGGGHGGGGADPPRPVFVAGILALCWYAWGLFGLPKWKVFRCRRALAQLSVRGKEWDPQHIETRVGHVFRRVQRAWLERDQDLARDCMSDRLYTRHKRKTDRMLLRHRQNLMREIKIKSITIVGVRGSADQSNNRLWVQIEATLVDYIVDDRSGEVLRGDGEYPRELIEQWTFSMKDGDWVADRIDQRPGVLALTATPCRVGAA